MSILIDNNIKSIQDEDNLQNELNNFLIKHYEKELKLVQLTKNISFEEKAFKIRSLRDKIRKLRLKK